MTVNPGARSPHAITRQLWIVVAVSSLAVAGLLFRTVARAPLGPHSSAYAAGPTGLSTWAQAANAAGHPVARARVPLDVLDLDPSHTVVLLDVAEVAPVERDALAAFVRAGGRLVVGGAMSGPWLAELAVLPSTTQPFEPVGKPAVVTDEVAGVSYVETVGDPVFRDGTLIPLLACRNGVVAGFATLRSDPLNQPHRLGLVVVADASIFQNRLIGVRDNGRFALQVLGEPGRPVLFAEAGHGFTAPAGVAALPGRVLLAALLLLVAAAVLAAARRTEAASRARPPAYNDHLAMVAARLADGGDDTATATFLRDLALDELQRASGTPEADLRRAAGRLGIDPADVDLLQRRDAAAAPTLEAAGRVLARTTTAIRR